MGSFLQGIHIDPDIWVVRYEDRTGFQMLTARAKKWAREYKEPEHPDDVNHMLWVPTEIAGQILNDIVSMTQLKVLLDDGETKND